MRDYILKFMFNMKIFVAFCNFLKLYYKVEELTFTWSRKIFDKQNNDKKAIHKTKSCSWSWNGTIKTP